MSADGGTIRDSGCLLARGDAYDIYTVEADVPEDTAGTTVVIVTVFVRRDVCVFSAWSIISYYDLYWRGCVVIIAPMFPTHVTTVMSQ